MFSIGQRVKQIQVGYSEFQEDTCSIMCLGPRPPLTLTERLRSLVQLIYSKIINMNLFPRLIFENSINRPLAISLGYWSTRLYILSLVLSLVTITLYTAIRPETLTYTLSKPSFDDYQKLTYDYPGRLECQCSVISAPYQTVLHVNATFHQVRKKNLN